MAERNLLYPRLYFSRVIIASVSTPMSSKVHRAPSRSQISVSLWILDTDRTSLEGFNGEHGFVGDV